MQTHTPGPWFVDQQGAPTVRTSNGSVVCGVPANPSDAILIAAAPQTVKALQRAAHVLAELPNANEPHILELRRQVVDAIRKATPEYYGEILKTAQ